MMKERNSLSEYQKEFLARIIGIPSVGGDPSEGAPYGEKAREVLRVFLDEAKAKGFRTGVTGDRAGWAEFGEGDRLLGIICHLDVVPVGDGWRSDPFTLDIREDEAGREIMYARGIVDDKGPACAAFFAMLELADEGLIPDDHRVRLILGTDEERTCSCIQNYAAHEEIPDFSVTPDSIFPVVYCEKGILHLKFSGENTNGLDAQGGSAVNIVPVSARCVADGRTITAEGKAAHASRPELGINAIELLAKAMEEQRMDLSEYPVMKFVRDFDAAGFTGCDASGEYGELSCNFGVLSADSDGCELELDLRIPCDADNGRVTDSLAEKASEYGLETQVTLDMPPFLKDKNSPQVRALTEIWKRHMDGFTGFKEEYRDIHAEPKVVGVGTYSRHIPDTIAFGIQAPWHTDQCHQADEHAAVTDFMLWIRMIREFIMEAEKYL